MCFFDRFQGRQSVDRLSSLLLRNPQLIETLQVKPKLRCRTKEMRKTKGCITRNRSSAVQDLSHTIGGNVELPCKLGSAHAKFLQLLSQMLARVNRGNRHNISPNDNQCSPPSRAKA